MTPMTRLSFLAASVLLVAGCSVHSVVRAAPASTSPSPAPSTPRDAGPGAAVAGPAPGPPCTVATAALVSAKLGFVLTGPNVDREPGATICTYDNPSNQAQSATVQLQYQVTAAAFATERNGFSSHGETTTDVPGLGEEAYAASLTIASVTNSTLVARKGTQEVLITSTAPTDRLPALMTAILAQLP